MTADSCGRGLEVGPRGRRLCWAVLDRLHPGPGSTPFWRAGFDPDPENLLQVLEGSLWAVDLAALSDPAREELLLECVAESVDSARYWQDPDEIDLVLADARLVSALAPVAACISAAPAAAWWSAELDRSNQVYVDKRADGVSARPVFRGAQIVLEVWRDQVAGPGTRHRGQWVGGPWWSTPSWSILAKDLERYGEHPPRAAATTRSRPGLGAVGLLLEEDSVGTPTALCWPVHPSGPIRVYEIDDAGQWMELVRRYGIDVTGKRIAHWSMATGLDRRWLLPDWSAVAKDYDAVHLTVNGYLRISGRALPVDTDSATFLSGWNPDVSFWLADVLEAVDSPQWWRAERRDDARRWRPARESP